MHTWQIKTTHTAHSHVATLALSGLNKWQDAGMATAQEVQNGSSAFKTFIKGGSTAAVG